ncbi:MAG: murein L,D-transpeptidase [Desulfobacula sp.]|nr:murein L,D-transpeptidase [Desulfobacula sp.]
MLWQPYRSSINKLSLSLLLLSIQLFLPINSTLFAANHTLPDAIIELPENENAIIVEKKTQTLFLYTLKAGDLSIDFKASCSTGEIEGIKQEAGDKKTPEGIYFLNDEYEDKYLSPIYGKKAFPTDYPNFLDNKAGKNGSAIWIHGTNKKLKPMDSNGCIALENSNILKLSDYINLDSTPVILLQAINMADKKERLNHKTDIHHMMSQWIEALETGTYHDYLSFYSPKYLPEISWWENWNKLRGKKNRDNSGFALEIKISRVGIYYHDQIFVSLFDCYLELENKKVLLGKRKLFLDYENGTYKIIGDVFQKVAENFQSKEDPLIAAATIFNTPDKKELVLKTIHQWLTAWSAKDMSKYASFYADNFHSDGLNKKKWVKRKQKLADKYDFINVSGQAYKIKFIKQTCEVIFFQDYESSGLTTLGTKKLKLVNKGGLWKIYQESWKKK